MRKFVLVSGSIVLTLLGLGALQGHDQAFHAHHWATRANGDFRFIYCGLATVAGTLLLGLFALTTSPWFDRLEWLLPVRGRWARQLISGIMAALVLLLLLLILFFPVA
jgi:hypothetical protein